MRRNNKKSRIIMFLCVALVFMGIGYATYQTRLTVTGTSRAGGSFNVEIINATPQESSTYTATTATLTAEFTEPGQVKEFDVYVQNKGSIDALLKTTLDESANVEDTEGHPMFYFESTYENGNNIKNGMYELDQGLTTIIHVIITYNEDAVSFPNGPVTFRVNLEAVQAGTETNQTEYQEYLDNQWRFKTENGVITAYNPLTTTNVRGYVVVPAVDDDGNPITEITSSSFAPEGNVIAFMPADAQSESDMQIYIDYERGSTEFNAIKGYLLQMGMEEDTSSVEGTISKKNVSPSKLFKDKISPKLKKIDDEVMKMKMYGKGEMEKPSGENAMPIFIDPETGEMLGGEGAIPSSVKKLDLTNATNLTTIGNSAFEDGAIKEIKFPVNGRLTTIGESAFEDSQLSGKLNLPSTIISIGNRAFENTQISGELVIPNGVTTIGENTFYGTQISSLTLPSTITSIGDSAFNSSQLTGTLTIPSSVTSIGKSAFGGNWGNSTNRISSLVFESNSRLQTIGDGAFGYLQLKGTLTIPSSVTSIGPYSFSGASDGSTNKLNGIIFESGSHLETIGISAFAYNRITGSITIPASVTRMDQLAFIGSSDGSTNQISSLIIENNTQLKNLQNDVFAHNGTMSNVVIPNGISEISSTAFLSTDITNLSIDIETISERLFEGKNIRTLILGSHIRTIDQYAFSNNQIETLNIPSGVTSIGQSAFSSNGTITNVTIPSSVTSISTDTFWNTYITNLNVDLVNIPSYIFSSKQIQTLILGPHVETIGYVSFQDNRLRGTLTIPSSVTRIESDAFSDHNVNPTNQISSLIFENGSHLQTIESSAFLGNALTSLTIPSSVEYIGDAAFKLNQISGTLTIPSSVTAVGNSAFSDNQIETLNIQNGIARIEEYAFANNGTITNVTIPRSITYLNSAAFSNSNITNLTIDMALIPTYAFPGINIQTLTLGSHVQTIQDSAFSGNQISGALTIPSNVYSIGFSSFASNRLKTLHFENGVHRIGSQAFINNQISTLTIPSSVTTIEENAFGSNRIETLNLGSGLTSVGGAAFHNSSGYVLSTINIDMTSSEWNNVTKGSNWYNTSDNPIINYLK